VAAWRLDTAPLARSHSATGGLFPFPFSLAQATTFVVFIFPFSFLRADRWPGKVELLIR